MNQLKADHKKFTHSIYGWDVDENGMLEPNWREQNYIDYMKWQGNAITRTIKNTFHNERKKFPYPDNWGSRTWHRQ